MRQTGEQVEGHMAMNGYETGSGLEYNIRWGTAIPGTDIHHNPRALPWAEFNRPFRAPDREGCEDDSPILPYFGDCRPFSSFI